MKNINTKNYWDGRFGSGDWEKKGGYSQTSMFAESQIPYLKISNNFDGTICDFGCGAGDAFPFYKSHFPNAKLIGVDFSESAIKLCRERYGHMADFICGDQQSVPSCDVVIASNVLEHLDMHYEIARVLSEKSNQLYIFVPYDEKIELNSEHVNSYNSESFSFLPNLSVKIFESRGWTLKGLDLLWQIHIKNLIRILLGRKKRENGLQVMFHSSKE